MIEDPCGLQAIWDRLEDNARIYGVGFASSKFVVVLQEWSDARPSLMQTTEVLVMADRFG